MTRRTVGTGAALLALVAAVAGCSSSGHKAASTTTTVRSSTTTRALATTSTPTAASTSTTAAPTPTTASPVPTTAPPDAQTADRQFFAAWIAHDGAGLAANGSTPAVNQATAQYAHTSGATWELSNCQGAAGSQYCTWVRAAEDVVVQASDVSPVNHVVSFQWNALQAPDIAAQFVNAWEFGATNAVAALATASAASQAQALSAHHTDGWQAPSSCDGTAGSFYCTYTAGSHKLIVQVGDVTVPHQVVSVTYQ
jgi:hypothetical protein